LHQIFGGFLDVKNVGSISYTQQLLYKTHSFADFLQSSRSSQAGNVAEQEI